MNLDWVRDISWVGTALVALGGLGATVWAGHRSGDVQIKIQEKQLAESQRVLEWQERRTAYISLMGQFQEYVDKVTIQKELDAIGKKAVDKVTGLPGFGSNLDEAAKEQVAAQILESVQGSLQEKSGGVLTMRDEWSLQSKVQDAANQARMIASPSVREGIDLLMLSVNGDEVYAAAVNDRLPAFRQSAEHRKRALTDLMNRELLGSGQVEEQGRE